MGLIIVLTRGKYRKSTLLFFFLILLYSVINPNSMAVCLESSLEIRWRFVALDKVILIPISLSKVKRGISRL